MRPHHRRRSFWFILAQWNSGVLRRYIPAPCKSLGRSISVAESAAESDRAGMGGATWLGGGKIMVQPAQQSSSYRVEVSAWDATLTFFVEKTVLHWTAARQELLLRSRLGDGAVVFVRLLQPLDSDENFPIAYVVEKSLSLEIDGRITVSIARLHPKPSHRQAARISENPKANCA